MVVEPLASDLTAPLEDGLSARALLSSIRRHLAIVFGCTFALCVVGTLVGLGLPAWFKAEGVLVIHARPQRMAEFQELPDPSPDTSYIQSEVDILSSTSVIEPVVRSMKLWEAPEFQEMEYPKGWSWETVKDRVDETWRGIWGPAENAPSEPAESTRSGDANEPTQAQIDTAVRTYMGYLTVSNDGHSNTIRISYVAWTPDRAAAVVNAHMESYRNLEVKAKMAAAEHANSALTSQVAELRQQLQTAEAAVTRYREEHHLTGAAKDSAGVSAQLAALNSQLMIARADLAENEARAGRISAGGESLPEVVASGTVSALRGQEAQLVAREADLAKYHGDEYPELRRVRASLQTLRDQISRQIGRDRAAALQTVERSRTRERSLQQSITELTKQLNSADAGLQQLQGKADSIRSLLVNFEKRVGETAANPAFITANSTVASHASESTSSTSSKTKVLGAAGGFVGFTLGSLLAVLMELRDKGFRTSMQVQQHTGALTVCATPRALGRKRRFPADIILTDNRSAFAEAFRVSWANIHLAISDPRLASFGGKRQGIALGITSASSGEGKSTHALALARTAALAGEDVVLVDADLRRAGVSRLLNQQIHCTLRDFLQDRCSAGDTLGMEGQSGVHFVPSSPANVSWTKHELHRFFNLIHYLKDRFTLVVIDFPPILGLADTLRLATAADSVALVIRWGRTERQFVQFALDALRSASVSTTAVILNDIDLKAQRRRGYRDHSVVYTDKGLYRVKPTRYQEPVASPEALPVATVEPESEVGEAEMQRLDPQRDQRRPAGSDIERLYNRYHD